MSPAGHVSISQEIILALQGSCIFKSLLFFLNVSVIFVGALIIGVAGVSVTEVGKLDEEFLLILEDNPEVLTGLYLILATGVILIFVGFCGCGSSLCEQEDYKVTLVLFCIVVTAMLLAQLMAFTFVFSKLPQVEVVLRDSMNFVLVSWIPLEATDEDIVQYLNKLDNQEVTQKEERYTLAWVKLQSQFKCCGYDSPKDWINILNVPAYAAYCTKNAFADLTASNTATRANLTRTESFRDYIYDLSKQVTWSYSCREIYFGKVANGMAVTCIVVFIIEFLIIVLSCSLLCKIRNEHKVKVNTQ